MVNPTYQPKSAEIVPGGAPAEFDEAEFGVAAFGPNESALAAKSAAVTPAYLSKS
jgi:hypothetical protein